MSSNTNIIKEITLKEYLKSCEIFGISQEDSKILNKILLNNFYIIDKVSPKQMRKRLLILEHYGIKYDVINNEFAGILIDERVLYAKTNFLKEMKMKINFETLILNFPEEKFNLKYNLKKYPLSINNIKWMSLIEKEDRKNQIEQEEINNYVSIYKETSKRDNYIKKLIKD